MTHFLLSFQGSSGNTAYLVDPGVFGQPRTLANPWMRAEHRATAFSCRAAALAARDALMDARRYEAPELNAGLERRLGDAVLIPVSIKDIGTVRVRNGHEVAITV